MYGAGVDGSGVRGGLENPAMTPGSPTLTHAPNKRGGKMGIYKIGSASIPPFFFLDILITGNVRGWTQNALELGSN